MAFLVVLLFVFLLICFHNFYWKRRNLPPGPTPVPILGNFIQFLWYGMEEALYNFPKQFGDIHTIWFGEMPLVTFNSSEVLQQYFVKQGDAFASRMKMPFIKRTFMGGTLGLIDTDGPLWREQRRFTLHVLRDFGMGKNLMQERILGEVDLLVKKLKSQKNSNDEKEDGIDIQADVDMAVGSVINSVTFGYRFTDDEYQHEFHEKKARLERIFKTFDSVILRILFFCESPWITKIPAIRKVLDIVTEEMGEFKADVTKHIEEHKKSLDVNSLPSDYVDAFLQEMKKLEDSGQTSVGFHYDQLIMATLDLWIAGQETTSTTLAFAFQYMLLYPEAQHKLQAEFDREIGSDRFITVGDKSHLPYAQAVIMEIQRCTNLLPFNIPRRLEEPLVVGDYTIPADTLVVPQIGALMYNSEIFPEPQEFKPERFIDADGNFAPSSDVLPFSIGKRACAGEALARMELFLFVTNLVNQFTFSVVPNNPPKPGRNVASTMKPHPYRVVLNPRFFN